MSNQLKRNQKDEILKKQNRWNKQRSSKMADVNLNTTNIILAA